MGESILTKSFKALDLYQRVPKDLTEATSSGAIFSICAGAFMVLLFHVELIAFLLSSVETYIVVDDVRSAKLPINFNITMLDIPCEYVAVDVRDVLGTNRQNVTTDIHKWHIDKAGVNQAYHGRNMEQKEIVMFDELHLDLDKLHANGVHAIPLNEETFPYWLKTHPWTFVAFFAPWCYWCKQLLPTWEAFAEHEERARSVVSVVSVDCVQYPALCSKYNVMAFPSMRLFRGEDSQSEYHNDRTVAALAKFASERVTAAGDNPNSPASRQLQATDEARKWPGCMVVGTVEVNRVPGNFHIEARSKSHSFNAAETNCSHVVGKLTFGKPPTSRMTRKLRDVDEEFVQLAPMNGKGFVTEGLHHAPHHYIKVVPTTYELGNRKNTYMGYQMLPNSQVMHYDQFEIPEARFTYNLSPMAISVRKEGIRWYEFLTSLLAIVGGTVTVIKLVDMIYYKMESTRRRMGRRTALGK